MSRTRIALFGGLLILVVLLVIGMSRRPAESSSPEEESIFVRAVNYFVTRAPAVPEDFPCRCRNDRTFTIRQSPTPTPINIRKSDLRVRDAILRLTRGARAQVRFEAGGEHAVPMQVRLDAGKEIRLSIFEDGGRLLLTCQVPDLALHVCHLALR